MKKKLLQRLRKRKSISNGEQTSYETMPPDIDDWRRATLDTAPFADRIQTVRGPCCEKAMIFDAMSCNQWMHIIIVKFS